MGLDTVKLQSPKINHGLAHQLEHLSIKKQGIQMQTGEILYEFTNGALDGSYDSRIMFRVMREEYRNVNGRPELFPCDPYIILEASVHKLFHGQNVYGDMTNFQYQCDRFVNMVGFLLAEDFDLLPSSKLWSVHRVDWAEVYRLTPDATVEFFRGMSHSKFPRRSSKTAKYGNNALYFPGTTTTLKLYHKGSEFKVHDYARVKQALTKWRFFNYPESEQYDSNFAWVKKKLKALQRLADNRLRVEVEIHSKKLLADFEDRHPLVSEITDTYLKAVHDKELFKLMKEGKSNMETVRTHHAVMARLNEMCTSPRRSKSLFSFWMLLASNEDDFVRQHYSDSQYYANKAELVKLGISWNSSNVIILPDQETALPRDFIPLRTDSRLCGKPVNVASVFSICPTVYQEMNALRDYRKAA